MAADPTDLRARLVAAFQAAAYDCDGDCGMTEAECHDAHPVQVAVLTFGQASHLYAPIDGLADIALGVVQAEVDQLERHVEELQDKLLSHGVNGGCCCSYDNPGDICMVHSPTVRKLEAEAERLRDDLAAYDLHHNGPPLRAVRDLPDIDQHQET